MTNCKIPCNNNSITVRISNQTSKTKILDKEGFCHVREIFTKNRVHLYEDFTRISKSTSLRISTAYDVVDAIAAEDPIRALVWCNDKGDEAVQFCPDAFLQQQGSEFLQISRSKRRSGNADT